jgi:hypothetical protein
MNKIFYKKKLSDFTLDEKIILIDSLKIIFPYDFLNIIQDYINSTSRNNFKINLQNPLTPSMISLYHFIIKNKICTIFYKELLELIHFFKHYEPTKNNSNIQNMYNLL